MFGLNLLESSGSGRQSVQYGPEDHLRGGPRRRIDMETGYRFNDEDGQAPQWMEDFADLSVDDLRELPHHMQLGMDLSLFD